MLPRSTWSLAHGDGMVRRVALILAVSGLAATLLLSVASWAGASWEIHAGILFAGAALLGLPALAGAARERRWVPQEPRWAEYAVQLAALFCVLNFLAVVLVTHPKPTRNPDPFIGRLFLAGWAYCYTYGLVWFWPRPRD